MMLYKNATTQYIVAYSIIAYKRLNLRLKSGGSKQTNKKKPLEKFCNALYFFSLF